MKSWFLLLTHLGALVLSFGPGLWSGHLLYAHPYSAPAPTYSELTMASSSPRFSGVFRGDLKDSDALHWGQGQMFIGADTIAPQGALSSGPDCKLYLSAEFVETEAEFKRLKSQMLQVASVKTFKNFVVPLPASSDPSQYKAMVIWCESLNKFITAAPYQ